jgi:uncharacterized membrane protein YbhN (UPF0104 family)
VSTLLRVGWWLGAAVLVGAAVVIAVTRRHELDAAARLISQVHGRRLVLAAAFEASSLVCFAAVQRHLLALGGVRLRLREATAVAVAANAVAGALPGGAAFATAWLYREFRRRGAGQVLAAAVLLVAGALSALSLGSLIVLGALTSGLGTAGPVLPLVLGATALIAAVGLSVLVLRRAPGLRARAAAGWAAALRRFRRLDAFQDALVHLVVQSRAEQPGLRPWPAPFALALLNWACDAACLAACMWALGIGVPWRGLLFAYGLTQIPGSLRLTPGSIGIVETSLAALLVAYGMPAEQAIAATVLYRIFSFWALQPVGWATWITLTLRSRRRPSHAP